MTWSLSKPQKLWYSTLKPKSRSNCILILCFFGTVICQRHVWNRSYGMLFSSISAGSVTPTVITPDFSDPDPNRPPHSKILVIFYQFRTLKKFIIFLISKIRISRKLGFSKIWVSYHKSQYSCILAISSHILWVPVVSLIWVRQKNRSQWPIEEVLLIISFSFDVFRVDSFSIDGLLTDVTRFFEWVTNNKDCFIYQYHILHVMLKQKRGSHHLSLEIRNERTISVVPRRGRPSLARRTRCDDDEHLYESHLTLNFVIFIYTYIFYSKLQIILVWITLDPTITLVKLKHFMKLF